MTNKQEKIQLVFKDDGFEEPTQVDLEEENIFVTVDNDRKIFTIELPVSGVSLVKRRTVERRVKSMARSGFKYKGDRIGVGYKIEVSGEQNELPDVLLQAGHGYQREGRSVPQQTQAPKHTPTPTPTTQKPPVQETVPVQPPTEEVSKEPSKYEKLGKKIYDQLQREKALVLKKDEQSIKIKRFDTENLDEFNE